jgi:L-alanine-DL-glutamate epimerase-like enolase superfamily enzyme
MTVPATQTWRARSEPTVRVTMIECVEATAYTVPTEKPEADGTLAWDSTTLVLAQVSSGGVRGIGWTYGSAACASVIADLLAPVVLGADAMDVPGVFEAMVRTARNAGRPGAVGHAISAVDLAVWDLKARLLGLPLHRLLGAVGQEIPVYGSGGFTSYNAAQLEEQLSSWVAEQRIPRVKIKIGESWGTNPGRDLERMAQARGIVGPEVELFVDANGGYGRKQAIRIMHAAAELDIGWVEEPVSSDDLDGLRQVRRHHRMAAGGRRCRRAQPPNLRPLRPPHARTCGVERAERAAPGVVPRPCADRGDVLRRHPRSHRRNPATR